MKHVCVSLVVSSLLAIGENSAFAGGALDWADPCVETTNTFKSNSDAARYRADQIFQEWEKRTEPPGELRGHYVEAFREGAYKAWSDDPTTKVLLDKLKAQDPNFDAKNVFLTQIYPQAITPENEAEFVRELYKADYEANLKPELIKSRTTLETQIASDKQKLDGSCKSDVVSQVLRGTIGNALIILGSNWNAAQNERGEVAKYFRAASGISLTDIQKYGIRGGPGSELSKLLGSDTSVASQVVTALDPTKWKYPFPAPKLPPIIASPPKIPPPTITLPGNKRVCIPWC